MPATALGFSVGAIDKASGAFAKVAESVDGLVAKLRGLDRTTASPTLDVDDKQLTAKIKAAEKRVADLKRKVEQDSPQLDLDIRAAEAKQRKLTSDLQKLRGLKVTPEVELKIAQAEAQLGRINTRLEQLRGKKVTPEVRAELAAAEQELAGFTAELAELDRRRVTVKVDADVDDATRKVQILDKSFGAATIRAAALARAMTTIALPGAIIAATPYIASLGASAVQAAGSLWLLPAAATAGGVAFGALAVGMAGFGDAMKELDDPEKFAEAIAKLSPAAREAANAVRSLVPAWTSMQQVVQDNLFAGVAGSIRELAGTYLPLLRAGLGGAAAELNQFTQNFTAFAMAPQTLADVPVLFNNVNASLRVLSPIVNNLLGTFRDIAVVGSAFLPQLAQGAVNATQRFQTFVHTARETGQLHLWIQTALDTMAQLGRIVGNVGSILGSVFAAGAASGESFLSVLERVTGTAAAALRTPEGAAALTGFFVQIREIVGIFIDKLVTLWPAISAAASAFAALLTAAAPVANTLLTMVVSALVPMLNAVEFLAPVLGPLAVAFLAINVAVGAASAVMTAWTAVTKTAGVAMTLFNALLHPIATATKAWALAQAGLNAVMAMNPITLVVIAIAALVGALVLAWNHSETFRNIVIGAWEAIKNAASAVFGWLANFFPTIWASIVSTATAAWNGLVSFITNLGPNIAAAATAAWNWLVSATQTALDATIAFVTGLPQRIMFALGALAGFLVRAAIDGWNGFTNGIVTAWAATVAFFVSLPARIGAFLTGLGAALVTFAVTAWNGFTTGLEQAWTSTVAFFTSLPARIGAFLLGLGATLVTLAVTAWAGFTSGLETGWAATIAFFVSLPARIGAFFANAGTWLLQTGLDLVAGLILGVTNAWNGLWGWIGGLIQSFIDGFKAGFGIASPSTIFAQIGGFLIQGLIQGIQTAAAFLWTVITSIAQGVVNFFMAGISGLAAMWSAVWNGIVLVFQTVWNTIRAVATAVWGGIVAYFQASWAAYQAMWSAVWAAVTAVFSAVWNGIRATAVAVWNGISAFFAGAFAAFQAFFSAVWNAVSAVFSAVWNGIRAAATAIWNAISSYFSAAFAAYQALFQTVWNTISTIFTTVWNFIRTTAVNIWNAIVAYFQAAFAAWTAFFQNIWNNIVAIFTTIWNWLRDTAVNAWNGIRSWFANAWASFTQFFSDTWQNIVNVFDRIWGTITGIAQRVWENVKNAFKTGVNAVIDVINIFAGAINKVAGLLGFNIDLRIPRLAVGGPISAASAGNAGTALAAARADGGPIGLARGGNTRFRRGGRLPYTGKNRDTLGAFAGGQPYALMGEEYVVRRSSTRAIGAAGMAAINNADNRPVDIVPRTSHARYRDGGIIGRATGGELGAAAQRAVPGTRITSTYRPGAAGYHGRNQAADLAGPMSMDTAFMHRINRWIASTHGGATNELIFTPGINLLNGRPHTYNAGTRADHYDHVHWAMAGPLGAGGGAGGGFFQSLIRPVVEALLKPLRDRIVPIRDDPARGFGWRAMAGAGVWLLDQMINLAGQQDAAGGGMDVSGISGPVVDQVRQVAARFGWDQGPEWDAIVRLVQKESSWNPNAANPRSSARGLFQKMTSLHGPVEPTPAGQAAWGLNYIRGRYGTPSAALRFHNANNHYDQGGLARGTGVMMKDVITPERVLSSQQTKSFEQLVAGLTSGRPQAVVANARVLDQLAADQQVRRGQPLAGVAAGITFNVDSITTPQGTSADQMAGALRRELRVAKHGGLHR